MADTTLTWLGHSAFRIDSGGGKRVYVDPFLNGNPKCPDNEKETERADIVAVTHAHGDHVGDTVAIAKKHGATVIAPFELSEWFGSQGIDKRLDPQKGGTVEVDGMTFTFTNAHHSSSIDMAGGAYGGEPCGIVVGVDGKRVYFAGDTCVFGDMQLIARLYDPHVAVLPIGGHYTMDPKEAALALELLGVKRCVPCHFGTFPPLKGTPDELAKLAPGVTIEKIEPGESIAL